MHVRMTDYTGDASMADLIGNEKLKSQASWLNTMSGATYAGGVALPLIGQITGASGLDPGVLMVLVGICLVLSVGLHSLGLRLLGGLDDTDEQ